VHTPVELYFHIPIDLFRMGTPTKPKFDYLRTSPPRSQDENYDVKIHPIANVIDRNSGGLSLFQAPDFSNGRDWWVIPKDTALPAGFSITKDLTKGKFKGHFSIRSLSDIHVDLWRRTLKEWADENAIHIDKYRKIRAV